MVENGSPPHCYPLYGIQLRSAWRFPFEAGSSPAQSEISLVSRAPSFFDRVRARAVVSNDGRQVACRRLGNAPPEVLHGYLLGAVLSFALIRQGIEPLHATVIA